MVSYLVFGTDSNDFQLLLTPRTSQSLPYTKEILISPVCLEQDWGTCIFKNPFILGLQDLPFIHACWWNLSLSLIPLSLPNVYFSYKYYGNLWLLPYRFRLGPCALIWPFALHHRKGKTGRQLNLGSHLIIP